MPRRVHIVFRFSEAATLSRARARVVKERRLPAPLFPNKGRHGTFGKTLKIVFERSACVFLFFSSANVFFKYPFYFVRYVFGPLHLRDVNKLNLYEKWVIINECHL